MRRLISLAECVSDTERWIRKEIVDDGENEET
jgi:hypothetical protein